MAHDRQTHDAKLATFVASIVANIVFFLFAMVTKMVAAWSTVIIANIFCESLGPLLYRGFTVYTLTVKRCKDLIIMRPLSQTCKTCSLITIINFDTQEF